MPVVAEGVAVFELAGCQVLDLMNSVEDVHLVADLFGVFDLGKSIGSGEYSLGRRTSALQYQ